MQGVKSQGQTAANGPNSFRSTPKFQVSPNAFRPNATAASSAPPSPTAAGESAHSQRRIEQLSMALRQQSAVIQGLQQQLLAQQRGRDAVSGVCAETLTDLSLPTNVESEPTTLYPDFIEIKSELISGAEPTEDRLQSLNEKVKRMLEQSSLSLASSEGWIQEQAKRNFDNFSHRCMSNEAKKLLQELRASIKDSSVASTTLPHRVGLGLILNMYQPGTEKFGSKLEKGSSEMTINFTDDTPNSPKSVDQLLGQLETLILTCAGH